MFRRIAGVATLVVALSVSITGPSRAQEQKGTLVFAVETLSAQTLDPILEGRPGNAVYQIRGQIITDTTPTIDASVGVYFDDVYISRAQGSLANFLDPPKPRRMLRAKDLLPLGDFCKPTWPLRNTCYGNPSTRIPQRASL